MAHTSNEQIRDDLLRHKIELQRFADGLAKRIRLILNRAEPSVRVALKNRLDNMAGGFDPGPVTTLRMRKLEQFIRDLNGPAFAEINDLVRTELTELVKLEVTTAANIVHGRLPVVVALSVPNARQLRSVVFARPMQNRILRDWLSGYEAGDRARWMDQIRQGLIFNETPTQISKRIFGTNNLGGADGVRNITRRGAQTLAQTTTAAINNGALQAFIRANQRIIKTEIYTATLDSRTTPICSSLDGNEYNVGEGPIPPIHMNCRSIRVPAVDGKRIGTRAADATTEKQLRGKRGNVRRRAVEKLVGQVPAETTYAQFLANQNVAFQNEVLGPTRGILFRKGGLTLDRFVDASGNQYTLPELFERERAAFNAAGLTPNLVPGL